MLNQKGKKEFNSRVKEEETISHCIKYGKLLRFLISQALILGRFQSLMLLPSGKAQVGVVKEGDGGREIVAKKGVEQI